MDAAATKRTRLVRGTEILAAVTVVLVFAAFLLVALLGHPSPSASPASRYTTSPASVPPGGCGGVDRAGNPKPLCPPP